MNEHMTVLVTGAGAGAGRAIAEGFLKTGATVIATDIKAPEWDYPDKSRLIRAAMDVTDEEAIKSIVTGAGINVLINNAGQSISKPVQDVELAEWRKIYDVNATGTFICTREVVRGLVKTGKPGRIINIASIAGKNAFANSSPYCAAKAGVIGFTRSLALELGPRGITVNAICPGSIDTAMIQGVIDNISKQSGRGKADVRVAMENSIPTRRFQQPCEVADLCIFLASDAAKSINGESINLDGGVVRD